MSSNGDHPSEHPSAIPSERDTQPEIDEFPALPADKQILALLRKLNTLADQRFEEIEFKRQILARLDVLEHRVALIPKRGEQ